jgi:integrase
MSYRVTGTGPKSGRIRKNFADRAAAEAYCNQKNAEEAGATAGVSIVQTRLSSVDIAAAESTVTRSAGRWPLAAILDAGLRQLETTPEVKPVRELYVEWLVLMEPAVSARWYSDLKNRVGAFLDANPDLTLPEMTNARVREWIDELDLGQQSKANMRNALHRFGRWLQERGYLAINPVSGIWLGGGKSAEDRAAQPSVFTALQAEAWFRACLSAECRQVIGWAVLCTFCGLRPVNEAPHALWSELNEKTGELHVLGRKRGVKARVLKLHPLALEWLQVVKCDGMNVPGYFSRRYKRRAVEKANAWLAECGAKPITWDEDIQRHTYASMRAGEGVKIDALAAEMGTSPDMIYGHYRHPQPAEEVKAFWAISPKILLQ